MPHSHKTLKVVCRHLHAEPPRFSYLECCMHKKKDGWMDGQIGEKIDRMKKKQRKKERKNHKPLLSGHLWAKPPKVTVSQCIRTYNVYHHWELCERSLKYQCARPLRVPFTECSM